MPSIIVQDADGDARVLPSKPFAYEDILQRHIADLPSLISLETVADEPISFMTIGAEWPVGMGRADIVLIGSDGVLTIVETKLSRNPESRREVIAQLLEYAAYLSEWTIYEVQSRAEEFFQSDKCPREYRNKTLDELLDDFLQDSVDSVDSFKGQIEQNLRQGRMRLIVAVDEVGEQAQKIVTFLNSYSSFDIYLLQVAEHEDKGGRRIFVPSLFGYARKVATTRVRVEWDWDKYRDELGWSEHQVRDAQGFLERLESVSREWQPERRLHQGWISVRCLAREMFGVQVFKKRGLELWFKLQDWQEALPSGVEPRQTKEYLYLSKNLDSVSDDLLCRLAEASLRQAGLIGS
jgi:hypothetical protein